MNRIFDYHSEDDKQLYFEENFEDLKLTISACTVANSEGKPNEDSFSIYLKEKCLWLAVFDGTTSLKPIPLLKDKSGARFASHFLKEAIIKSLDVLDEQPKKLLITINSLLLEQAKLLGGTLEDTHTLPASMATVVKIDLDNNILEFAHVGDTYGIVYKVDGSSIVFTDDKNKKFDQEMFSLMESISKNNGITIKQARQDEVLKKALYDMFIKRNNNPNGQGSGLINGDSNVEKYIQTGEYSLGNIGSILLATDGLEIQGSDIADPISRFQIFQEFTVGGFQRLIELKKDSEDKDPDWNNIRYKHSDDATGIMVSINMKEAKVVRYPI